MNYDPARMKKLAFHFLSLNGEDEVIFLLRRTDDLAEVLFFFSFEDLAMSERSRERGRCRAGKSGTEKMKKCDVTFPAFISPCPSCPCLPTVTIAYLLTHMATR